MSMVEEKLDSLMMTLWRDGECRTRSAGQQSHMVSMSSTIYYYKTSTIRPKCLQKGISKICCVLGLYVIYDNCTTFLSHCACIT